MRNFKTLANICFAFVIGALALTSCESDADALGYQFLEDNAAVGVEHGYDIVAYNLNNNDSIRSDAAVLSKGILGAFSEPVYGSQKTAFVSQIRPAYYNPKFGDNPKVDSVVLSIVPNYSADSEDITSDTITIDHNTDDSDTLKIITSYPIVKYGNSKIGGVAANLTLEVHEVLDFLYGNDKKYYSNHQVNTGNLLGSGVIEGGIVKSVKMVEGESNTEISSTDPAIKIPLDAQFFQQKIIDKEGQNVLNDAASFIRYFRGLRISTVESDGYLFSFDPDDVSITVYYTNETTDDEGEVSTHNRTFTFNLGGSNAYFEQYEFDRPSSFESQVQNADKINGDKKLYLQGTGGPGAVFKIPDATIQAIKNLYTTEKIAIVSAKIRVYSDQSIWDNDYEKPSTFTVLQEGVKDFTPDMLELGGALLYQRVAKYAIGEDTNAVYYDISVTQTLKDIIEEDDDNHPIVINVGDFLTSTASSGVASYLGWQYTTRAYTPNRLVLVGADTANPDQSAQLKIIYTKAKK